MWDDCIESKADVTEEHPHITVLILHMGKGYTYSTPNMSQFHLSLDQASGRILLGYVTTHVGRIGINLNVREIYSCNIILTSLSFWNIQFSPGFYSS